MMKVDPLFSGFKKTGEKVSEENGIYCLEGEGTDIGCNLVIMEEMAHPSLLEFEIRGKIEKKSSWARLRIELFDRDNINDAATSYEDDYLTVDLNPQTFRHLSFPVLGICKNPHRVQFMIVGPAKSKLEIKNVVLR
jgi:hypothetical protein